MGVLFPKAHSVIRRNAGSYVNGEWRLAGENGAETLPLNIQPPGNSDYTRLQAVAPGRRLSSMLIAYAGLDAGLKVAGDGHPGDVVLYNGRRWLVIGESRWDSFDDPDTSHLVYMLALEAEHSVGEAIP